MNRNMLSKSILMTSMLATSQKKDITIEEAEQEIIDDINKHSDMVLRGKVHSALRTIRDDAALTEKTARSGRINPQGSLRIGSYKFKSRKN